MTLTTASTAPLIVHVFPTFAVGGAQVRFAALANHFGAAFRHMVVALDGNLACKDRLRTDLDIRFPIVAAPKNALLVNAWRFRQKLRDWRPDVLVTGNWGAIEFAVANILPVARHIHVEDGFGPEEREAQIARRIVTRRVVLHRSTVVLPSHTLVRVATESWKLNPNHVRHVPNGIDLTRFAAPRHRPNPEVFVIGTVAALREEKNLARLIRGFAMVKADRPVHLTIVGDGAERMRLAELAQACGVADRVTFTGHRDDTPGLYAAFDVFALSSDTEQMPLSVIEAMASGLPVASTDVGDVRTMVAAENRPFVGPLDDRSLAASLTSLLNDHPERQRIGQANLAKAHQEFDQARMFEAWKALWAGVVQPA